MFIVLLDHQVDFNCKLLKVYILILNIFVLLLLQGTLDTEYDLLGHLVHIIVEDLALVLEGEVVRMLVPC